MEQVIKQVEPSNGRHSDPALSFNQLPLSKKITSLLTTVSCVTKTLRLQAVSKASDKRKLVISTNWLPLFNFVEKQRVIESVIGPLQGMTISNSCTDESKTKQVYGRNYSDRARETMMDIRHQGKIDGAFGSAKDVHITFEKDCLTIVPIFSISDCASNEGVVFDIAR